MQENTVFQDWRRLFSNEHGFYTKNKDIWRKNVAAYSGGAEYIHRALVEHLAEVKEEYAERCGRAYYFNYPRKIARLITQFIFAVRAERDGATENLVEDFDRDGHRVDEVMRQFCTMMTIYGCAWLIVDMPSFKGTKTKADEIKERLRPYCKALSPLAVKDWCYGEDKKLDWAIVAEREVKRINPFADPVVFDVRKLWTRETVTIYTQRSDGKLVEPETIQHGLGVVPLMRAEEIDGYGIDAQHWFEDLVRISDAILNNESEGQMNIVKQTFGLLVVGESFARGTLRVEGGSSDEEDTESNGNTTTPSTASIIARSAAVVEGAEDKGVTRYICPPGSATETIRVMNANLVRMLFDTAMMTTNKETKMVESAEAKAWDFQAIEQYMKTRADMLEQCEYRAWELMKLWSGNIKLPKIIYNRNFAVLELKDAVTTLMSLSAFNVNNEEYQHAIDKTAVAMLNRLRQITQAQQEAINATIDKSKIQPQGAAY